MTKGGQPDFTPSNHRLFLVLVSVTASLIVIHLVLQALHHLTSLSIPDTLVGRFDVDNEISIPTWWIQILLFISSVLGVAIYKLNKDNKGRTGWLVFSTVFLFFSIDEGAMLHESVVTKLRDWTSGSGATGLANHLWLIPATILVLAGAIIFIKFARSLPKRTFILLGSGIAVLVFGGVFYEAFGLMVFSDMGSFWYHGLNVAIEEGLEMTGASLTIYALLDYISNHNKNIAVEIKP